MPRTRRTGSDNVGTRASRSRTLPDVQLPGAVTSVEALPEDSLGTGGTLDFVEDLDIGSVGFLVEAMSNAEPEDWGNILAGFAPDPSVVPTTDSGIIAQCRELLMVRLAVEVTDPALPESAPDLAEASLEPAPESASNSDDGEEQERLQSLKASMHVAGFLNDGEMWTHKQTLTYVTFVGDEARSFEVWTDAGLDAETLDDWIAGAWNKEELQTFGQDLIDFVKAPRPCAIVPVDDGLRDLVTISDLSAEIGVDLQATRLRLLIIYTWGDANQTQASVQQQADRPSVHLNAKPLNGRGGGADTTLNATQDPRIVRNVCSSMKGGMGRRWLINSVRQIEAARANCISVFCRHGRHRSVGAALILKAHVYPNAQLRHLKMR